MNREDAKDAKKRGVAAAERKQVFTHFIAAFAAPR
jgi:hypothetical protein